MTYITAPDYLIFKNSDAWYVNVQCQNGQTEPTFTYPGTGILYIDSYVNCKKDINCWGAFMTTSPSGITGGGAIQMGHGFTDLDDAPMITLIDSGSSYGGYNTLWLKQGDRDPNNRVATNWLWANLELGNLIANDMIKLKFTHLVSGPEHIVFNKYDATGSFWWRKTSTLYGNTPYTEMMSLDNSANLTMHNGNIIPASANVGNIGTNTQYWGSMWTNYLRYKNISSFDALDDLALAKSY